MAPEPALAGWPAPADDDDDAAAEDGSGAVWFAVPKSRISKGKKRIKNANAGPKPVNFGVCDCCGKPVTRHHMWKSCIEAAAQRVAGQKAAAASSAEDAVEAR